MVLLLTLCLALVAYAYIYQARRLLWCKGEDTPVNHWETATCADSTEKENATPADSDGNEAAVVQFALSCSNMLLGWVLRARTWPV